MKTPQKLRGQKLILVKNNIYQYNSPRVTRHVGKPSNNFYSIIHDLRGSQERTITTIRIHVAHVQLYVTYL